jgi:L-fucose isomerase-like protein
MWSLRAAIRRARFLEACLGMNTFKADIEEIRRRARDTMEDEAVTGGCDDLA